VQIKNNGWPKGLTQEQLKKTPNVFLLQKKVHPNIVYFEYKISNVNKTIWNLSTKFVYLRVILKPCYCKKLTLFN
jgi:hypothetical protein